MGRLTDWLLGLQGLPVYALVGLLVFAEDALFVGFVLPGETAAILGGVAASLGHASLPLMLVVVISAAIIGDSVGYEVGRHLGPRILRARPLQRHSDRLDDARRLLARRGGTAVFIGRFVAFFRATMPALAGTSGMRYLKFLAYNAAGGIVWGTATVMIGYLAGHSYAKVEKTFGRATALIALAIVLIAIVVWRIRRHRAQSTGRHETSPVSGPPAYLADVFTNVGVTSDDDIEPPGLGAGFDGAGSSYSKQALAAAGLQPGKPVTIDGVTLEWPDTEAGAPNNVVSNGQRVRLDGRGSTIGVLTAATYGPASGDWVVHYADGSTQVVRQTTPDWTNSPPDGTIHAADTAYCNSTGTELTARRSQIFLQRLPVDSDKELAALTLPVVSPAPVRGTPALHVFAIVVS